MSDFDLAVRRIEQGHRVRFYQDFYGRQWVKVHGGWKFWRTGSIFLRNEEIVGLKKLIALKRASTASMPQGAPSTMDAA